MISFSSRPTALARVIRRELLHAEGVTKLPLCRRFHVVYSVGEPSDRIFYLESGLVKIFVEGADQRQIIFSLVHPGELFGEQTLLSNVRRVNSAEVIETATMYVIPKAVFQQFVEKHPEVWQHMTELLLARQRILHEKIELLTLRSVQERLVYFLDYLADVCGHEDPEGGGILVHLSQNELAGLVGATRETTSSTLNLLARAKRIELRRRQILLRRPAKTPAAFAAAAGDADGTMARPPIVAPPETGDPLEEV
jgi:CRP/FNR family transcriptional regulator, cyclic AMP receptor protein